LDQDSLGDL